MKAQNAAPSPRTADETPELSLPLHNALDEATRCIQCGFCLPACPTYKVFGEEKHSPRGRIQLIKSWAEGKTEPDGSLLTALDLCLDCRACETACPIDVQYGRILTGARDEFAERAAVPGASTMRNRVRGFLFRTALRHIVAHPRRVGFFARVTHSILHSRLGSWMHRIVRRSPDSWLASALTFAVALPRSQRPSKAERVSPVFPASPEGGDATPLPAGRKAALFLGCAQEGMFPETNRATEEILEQAGFDIAIPTKQGCCGALHRHYGDKSFARTLVLRNLETFGAFDEDNDDPIVMNAGGCMAWMKQAAELFKPGSDEHRAAERMAARTCDISEIVLESRLAAHPPAQRTAVAPQGPRVVYQPSCHLTNVCGISAEPLALLQRITGGNAVLPNDGGSCCGSAGIYNALHPRASRAVLEQKMEAIGSADPDVIVTSNPGCHLQMIAGVRACGLEETVRVVQLADFVTEYGRSE